MIATGSSCDGYKYQQYYSKNKTNCIKNDNLLLLFAKY